MDARRPLRLYASLMAASFVFVLLPGGPYYPETETAVFSIAVAVGIVVFLWRGSRAAWVVAVALHGLTVAALVLFTSSPDFSVAVIFAFELTLLAILLTRPVRVHVGLTRSRVGHPA